MSDTTRKALEAARQLIDDLRCNEVLADVPSCREVGALLDAALADVAPAEPHCICRKLGGCKYGGLPVDLRCECRKCHGEERRELEVAPAEEASLRREGFVTVYDSQGRYVGCMGERTWQRSLKAGERREPASPMGAAAESERCQHCSFDPTSLNDYCAKHRPVERREPASAAGACPHCDFLLYAPGRPAWSKPPEPPERAALRRPVAALEGRTVDDFAIENDVVEYHAALAAAELALRCPWCRSRPCRDGCPAARVEGQ